ncbi:MAG: hypothetical protein HYR55_09470 [Acidobacteria bacterium]|nr:hypothetical protein [Acidobacteriota bacterium]MBI3656398.1 hypothetical protein [Acidobacteriota bacterium]
MKAEKETPESLESVETTCKPENGLAAIGLDIGTSRIVCSQAPTEFKTQLNAFIGVAYSKFAEQMLQRNGIDFYRHNGELFVLGDGAEKFASMFNHEVRRPMSVGLLNPGERDGFEVIQLILRRLLKKPKPGGSKICFSIPSAPCGMETSLVYHENMIKRFLTELGFESKSLNEGLAVVFSELANENFSGIGISFGGGMCNACLAYLSIPILTFSLGKAGDWIDSSVSVVTGESATRVRVRKESALDLSAPPSHKIDEALHIYYEEMILDLVRSLTRSFVESRNLPTLDKPIPVVLSGGTSKPRGFREKFENALRATNFPLAISEVRLAADPLNTTAKGTLMYAMYDN